MSRLRRRLFGRDAPLIELLLVLQAIIWGLNILIVKDMHHGSPLLREMQNVVPEDVWGVVMLFFGLGGLWAWMEEADLYRAVFALAATFFWSFLSFLILKAGLFVTTTTTLPLYAIFSGMVYVRLSGIVRSES